MTIKRITDLSAAAALDGEELIEVSQLSTTVAMTASTLSAQASDNSYNDSAAQFIAEGFSVGDRVRVSGFTGNVANNILVGIVTALTAGKMTIGGTDGDVIVDDAAGESVTISKWSSRRATLDDIVSLIAPGANPTESLIVALGDETTAVTVGNGKVTFRMPYAFTLSEVRLSAVTAPTGSTLIVDINEGGASILSTKLTLDAGEKTSTTAATPAVISDVNLADDAEITIDIDQIGSTIAGAGLKVALIGARP